MAAGQAQEEWDDLQSQLAGLDASIDVLMAKREMTYRDHHVLSQQLKQRGYIHNRLTEITNGVELRRTVN